MAYVTYRLRWVILAAICTLSVFRLYTSLSFAITNDVVSEYLQVSAYQVDVLATADTLLAVFVCLVLSLVGKSIGIRAQTILSSGCMLLGAAATAVAFTRRDLYWCLVIGRLLAGVPTGVLYVLPTLFANAWFPPEQIATAFSLPFMGFSLGGLLGTVVFSNLLPKSDLISGKNSSSAVEMSAEKDQLRYIREVFVSNMAVTAGVMALCTLIFWLYAKNRPPTPPSGAQERIIEQEQVQGPEEHSPIRTRLSVIIELLTNHDFLLITSANFLSCTGLILAIFLSPSMLHATFPTIDNRTSGYVVILIMIGGFAGSFVAGKLLDKFGLYKKLSAAGTLTTSIVSVGVYLGHRYQSLESLFVLYPLLMFFRTSTVTTDIEFLVETTYPIDKSVLVPLHFAFYNLGFFASISVERFVMNAHGALNAPLVSVICNSLAFVCLIFVKPSYRRREASRPPQPAESGCEFK